MSPREVNTFFVMETTSVGGRLGAVIASDPNGEAFVYAITNTEGDAHPWLRINEQSGELFVTDTSSLSVLGEEHFVVTVTDSGGERELVPSLPSRVFSTVTMITFRISMS